MDGRKRILVLDADERLLIELERLLEDAGFDTLTTWQLPDALQLLHSRHFDMVLIGDHPPEIPAHDVLKQISKTHSVTHCAVLHSAERAATEDFRSLGAFAVIDNRSHNEIVQLVKKQFGGQTQVVAA